MLHGPLIRDPDFLTGAIQACQVMLGLRVHGMVGDKENLGVFLGLHIDKPRFLCGRRGEVFLWMVTGV